MSTSVTEPAAPTPEELAAWAEAEAAAERELAEADAAAARAAAAAATAPAATPAPRPAGRKIPAALLFALPVALAVSAGAASAFLMPKKETPEADEPADHHAAAPVPPSTGDIGEINILIQAGSFTEALAQCHTEADYPPAVRRALAYREGVCLEALGRLKDAAAAYKKAEVGETNTAAWARAVLGRARCAAAADDLAAVQNLLDRVLLRSGHPDCAKSNVFEECLFMRARLAALRDGPVRATDPFDPDAVAWPPLAGALDKYFEWLPPDTLPAGSSGGLAGPTAIEVRRVPNTGGVEITAHCAERPAADALAALATAAGLKVQTDDASAAALAKQVVAVDVEGVPLDDVVAALAGYAGAGTGWKIEGGVVVIGRGVTAPVDREATARALARAYAVAPKHPRQVAVRLWRANFDFLAGRTREAAREYQDVLDKTPEAPEIPHAVYNIGLTELRTGGLLSARSRFVDLVDRAPNTRWAEYGWWWAGRTYLDVGDRPAAKQAFQSALTGRAGEVASAAVIGICACELHDGNDEPAREALDEVRGAAREEHAALRAALEAILRYRKSPTEGRRELLLTALREASDGRGLGTGGVYLVGQVYRELKMSETMVAVYTAATDTARGPLAIQMTFEVAEWYDLLDRRDAARQRYLAVAATDPKGLGPVAELKLAGMALRAGNPADCIRRCRALVDRTGADRREVLAFMGRAYEQLRNYRAAAECFAGRVPAE